MINELVAYICAIDRFVKQQIIIYIREVTNTVDDIPKINVILSLFNCCVVRYIYFKLAPTGSIVAFLFSINSRVTERSSFCVENWRSFNSRGSEIGASLK